MNNKFRQALLSSLGLGLTVAWHPWRAEAAIIGSETPNVLSLSFSTSDSYPPGNSPYSDSSLVPLFAGQYWQVSAQSLSAPTGPAIGRSNLFVQQAISGQDALPSAIFGLSLRNTTPYTQQISYPANAPAQIFKDVTCPFQSANCVSYELREIRDPNDPNIYTGLSYELKGFFQPSESSKPVPETPTGVGALAALGLIAVLRVKKRYFTVPYSRDYSS
jgi:hypothetical protein